MKRVCSVFFYSIVFLFSCCFLILSLLTSIRIAAVKDDYQQCRSLCSELRLENYEMTIQYENLSRLNIIEEYALEDLGMQSCSAGQIIYIPMAG